MFYLRNLRIRLNERIERLRGCGHFTYVTELSYLLRFLDENQYIRGLLTAVDAEEQQDFETWVERPFGQSGRVQFPRTEAGRAKMCLGLLRQCAHDPSGNESFLWGRQFGGGDRLDSACAALTESVAGPLINYLHDQIEEAGNILFILERFKRNTEWFTRNRLFLNYVENTSAGESNLDQALRQALFEGGIDYPFSQPASPSGKTDVVALLGSDDPMVLEVKVYDPDRSRTVSHLRQGFHQVLRYSDNYNQNVGYLVIFNCSSHLMAITDTDSEPTETPTRIKHANKTFFVFVIDVNPETASASRENPSSRRVIQYRDLVGTAQDHAPS